MIALHHAGGNRQTNAQGDRRYVNEGILISWIKNIWAINGPATDRALRREG